MPGRQVVQLFQSWNWDLLPGVAQAGRTLSADDPAFVSLDKSLGAFLDFDVRQVKLAAAEPLPENTLEHFTCDLLLPRLLAGDGHLVLHAGTVSTPSGGIGFLGPTGIGKSTLTAAFHVAGHDLLGDDVSLLEEAKGGTAARSLYRGLRLLPDSVARLLPADVASSPMAHYTEKRRIEMAGSTEAVALSALFLLAPENADFEAEICRIAPADACMALIGNSFALRPSCREEGARRFLRASEVARQVPMYSIRYPRDYDLLPKVVDRILETAAARS